MMPSNLQEFFGLIAFFGFAALVIHSLWQASKRVPPATDRLPAGVDGALLIVAGLAFLAGIYDAAAAALAYQYVGAGDAFAAQCALNAFGAALFFYASIRLFFGRRPRVRAEAALSIAVAGPLLEATGGLFLAGTVAADWIAWFSLLCTVSVWAIWVILRSEASRNTYGASN